MSDPSRRSRASLTIMAALALGAGVAACGPTGAGASGSGVAASLVPSPTASASDAGDIGDASLGPLVVDPSLLRILPAGVAGIAMQPSPQSAASMASDASLARSASALAVGVVAAAGGSRGDDLAVSSVIRLRPGVYTDTFYQHWMEAYDVAACDVAGGIASHVQQLIGSHTVEVTVCSQGARTYHTHLAGDILVSITAVGDRKFGDLVMAGLRQ